MSDELKPCPFCGSEATVAFSQDGDDARIMCSQWKPGACLGSGPWAGTLEKAIAAWNRRAPAAPAVQEPVAWKYRVMTAQDEWRVTLNEEWARCNNADCGVVPLYAAPVPAIPPKGRAVSVDASTGEDDADHRIFATLTGEVGSDGETWLAIENSRNFVTASASPAIPLGVKGISTSDYWKNRCETAEKKIAQFEKYRPEVPVPTLDVWLRRKGIDCSGYDALKISREIMLEIYGELCAMWETNQGYKNAIESTPQDVKDAQRYRKAIAYEDNADLLHMAVLNHGGGNKNAIDAEFDAEAIDAAIAQEQGQ